MDPETNKKQAEVFRAMAQDLCSVSGERQRLIEVFMFHKSSPGTIFLAKLHL